MKIIEIFYRVYNRLGYGLLEKVYEHSMMIEFKRERIIARAQLLNYLRATNIEVGLLFNFGPEPEIKRKVYDNHRKKNM